MPLKLVTGPANSAKAGEVLGGYRAHLDEEPILVVPEFRDVEHAQREMAANGAVFGVRVLRFDRLWREMARWVGYSARVATAFQRERLIAQAVADADLAVLAASAAVGLALAAFASLEIWTWYTSVGIYVVVGTTYGIEYAVRRARSIDTPPGER